MSTTQTISRITRRSARAVRLLVALLVVAASTVALTVTGSLIGAPAHALCASTMNGTWSNIDASTRSVTRVQLAMRTCGDTVLCDAETGVCHSSPTTFALQVFGSCQPTDCAWGERITFEGGDGWQRATYVHSWATKHVWVRTYTFSGRTYLRVYVSTDFTAADGRQDYVTDEWMLK